MTNKNSYLVIVLLLMLSISKYGQAQTTVSTAQAQKVAETFTLGRSSTRAVGSTPTLKLVYTATKSGRLKAGVNDTTAANVYYHVFNVGNNNGFVIVAGNDVAKPILGYADHGSFGNNYDSLPDALKDLLSQYQGKIQWAIDHKVKPDSSTRKRWTNYRNGVVPLAASSAGASSTGISGPSAQAVDAGAAATAYTSGTYFVQTLWDQTAPYNNLFPSEPGLGLSYGGHAYTGCSITATAQILYYYETQQIYNVPAITYPIPAYTTTVNGGATVTLPAVPAGTTFDWADMLDTQYISSVNYTNNSITPINYNSTQANAVAQLMSAIGTSQTPLFLLSETGALASNQSMFYFGFQISTILDPDNLSLSDYETALKNEIDSLHPLYYNISGFYVAADGTDSSEWGAHTVVCDGYDSNDNFHLNFGWSGQDNGFYSLSAFDFMYDFDSVNVPLLYQSAYVFAPLSLNLTLTNLNATVSNFAAALSWNGVSGATGYTVWYRPDSASSWTQAQTPTINNNGLPGTYVQNLAVGTYYWRVAANNGTDTIASAIDSFTVPPYPTFSAGWTASVSVNGDTAILSWTAANWATAYSASYEKDSGGTWIVTTTPIVINNSIVSVSVPDLAVGTYYGWSATASRVCCH